MRGRRGSVEAGRKALTVMTALLGDGSKPMDVGLSTDLAADYMRGQDALRETTSLIQGLVDFNRHLIYTRKVETGIPSAQSLQEYADLMSRLELEAGD
ncbi:MAG: hypothetical protein ACK4UY_04115 [Dietzia sp.]